MDTKVCTKCGQELPLDLFSWRNKQAGTKRSECKSCQNAYMRMEYQEKKEAIQALKSQECCAKCGESRGYVLDYHHINPDTKENTIARMISNNYGLTKVYSEIEKCIVLCANCHREFHHLENQHLVTNLLEYLDLDIKA
jgi:hypothetical protein